ncbi:type II and III secretion system protein family protein [Roseicella aerolata]|uniref:Type II and III secretion system protein family protein n=1 Tax=Roseicella aerolata TaxID=2883479 RepID=A0A9X1IHW5_9PROT|nr:type II and III secretion system protein family protein [Roseicella aerolata]MCB4824762.1 type II and III secretion system protein family protein [Roseicella aerolata]
MNRTTLTTAVLAASLATLPALAQPMQPAPGPQPGQAAPQAALAAPTYPILLESGAGRLLQLPRPAATVLAADPRIARVQPASPTSLFLVGVGAGRTTVIATSDDGTPVVQYDVTVRGGRAEGSPAAAAPGGAPAAPRAIPAATVQGAIRQVVPGASQVQVRTTPGGVILTGPVPSAADSQRVEAIARGFLDENQVIQNQMEVLSSVQVNLRVRVLEISREVTRNLGFNWQALGRSGNFVLGLRSGPGADSIASAVLGGLSGGALAAPALLGAAYRTANADVNAIVDALAEDQLITILAEPNLTAQSGESASFLAGGEFPIPVQATISGQVSIQFKQFGVGLSFVPTVLGPDRMNLRVRPEVSELSQNGAIVVPLASGTVRIPALAVRRAETTVEVGSGQSFAIAGLLQRSTTQVGNGVAGIGEVPVLGGLFRSERFRRAESELVIIVTPYLVRPVSDPRALSGPSEGFRPATDLDRLLYNRQIARGSRPATPIAPVNAGFILN